MTNFYDIKGKVAVVTGGAKSMGLLTAQRLVELGAKVVVGDIEMVGEKEVEKINSQAGECVAIFQFCDVSDSDMLHSLIDLAIAEFGGLDILVNNVGIFGAPLTHDPNGKIARQVVNVNLGSVIDATTYALHYWNQSDDREGIVVNLSSLAAYLPMEFMATYSSTKAGISQFTKCLATLAPKVRVNAVAPGAVDTQFIDSVHLGRSHFAVTSSGLLQPCAIVDQIVRLIHDTSMAGEVILIENNKEPSICDRPNGRTAEANLKKMAMESKN
ncbi:hypothetical protein GGI07_005540 [Coemansia sp. Benny D115]|nr:hypothetical protein GGI07_005540 [Coemansia sp. Benny D115]